MEEVSLALRLAIAAKITKAFGEDGYKIIVYGGTCAELYTRGAYATGDIDMGFIGEVPSLEKRKEILERLQAKSFGKINVIDGVAVDLGGEAELWAKDPQVIVETDSGTITCIRPEEILIDRILQAIGPGGSDACWQAARVIIQEDLRESGLLDWNEIERICSLPGCNVKDELAQLQNEVKELQKQSSPDKSMENG